MTRPYINFQIDGLEAEFERAREEGDANAVRKLQEELAGRRQSVRVIRLAQMVADELSPAQAGRSNDPGTASAERRVTTIERASLASAGNGSARSGTSGQRQAPPRNIIGRQPPRFKPT